MVSGWRIKKADDTVYGPVDWPEILQWASQGRIDPADALSANGQHWVPAPSLAELKLIWMVTLHDDSAAGPYHASTLLELLHAGSVHENTPVYHAITQAPSTVHAVLKAAVLAGEIEVESASFPEAEGAAAPEPGSPQGSGEVEPEAAPGVTLQDELAAARVEIENLRSALQRALALGQEGEAERQGLSERLAQMHQEATALHQRLDQLEMAASQAAEQGDVLRRARDAALQETEMERQRLGELLAQAQQEAAEGHQRLEQLATAADKAAKQCDLLQGERDAARQEVSRQAAALEAAARQQQQLQEAQEALCARCAALEKAQQTAKAAGEVALRQAADAERAARATEQAQGARQRESLQRELADLRNERERERLEAERQIRALREAQAATEARLAEEAQARQRAEQALQRMPPPAGQPSRPATRPSVPASGALASSDLYRLPARRTRESGGAELRR